MTIVLDVSFDDTQQESERSQSDNNRKKVKHNACSSKAIKVAKAKYKNEKKSKKLSSASSASLSTATTNSSSPVSIKDSLIDNKEKLNDLNDQILNSQQLSQPNFHCEQHVVQRSSSADRRNSFCSQDYRRFNPSHQKTESIMSSDSDIRFTRKKLGDNQRCGCILIAGFLVLMLIAGLILYAGYIFLHSKPQPNRIFRGRIRVIEGDYFTMNLTDQNSAEFFEKSREYRERINLLISRSDFRKYYEGSEILALDGRIFDSNNLKKDIIVHFLLNFDPKSDELFVEDLRKLFVEEFQSSAKSPSGAKYFKNLKMDLSDFQLKEINFGKFEDIFATSSASHVDSYGNSHDIEINRQSEEINIFPPRTCEPVKLKFCRQIGYNMTTFPNLLGHHSLEEIEKDLIAFREIIDSECFLDAYDFLCNLLQPACENSLDMKHNEIRVKPRFICRDYCNKFAEGCLSRIPKRFKAYFDCERYPEQTSIQSCRQPANSCITELKNFGQGLRICDGIADCPNLEDELACSYCPSNSLHCGKGRSCISREMRCDGKFDCFDGSDEKDCLSISPLVHSLVQPKPLVPYRPKFHHEGFAVFSEKGQVGKLCAEGMESNEFVRSTVAESLCKALGYERVTFAEVRNDTEADQNNYVRVLNPAAAEISFVRTGCHKKEALYLSCRNLECGKQSVITPDKSGMTLPKMSMSGDWPFVVALFKKENHVCDGTLVSSHWVLTTASCFQGQSKEKWVAVLGNIRIGSTSPWAQKRRIIGMVKSPVEGSTVALVRLQTPVAYSDFVRPVCLPDDDFAKNSNEILTDYPINSPLSSANLVDQPRAEKFFGKTLKKMTFKEDRQFFKITDNEKQEDDDEDNETIYHEITAEHMNSLKPEAQVQSRSINYYAEQNVKTVNPEHNWEQCNTLGWSRQKEHLQRVSIKHVDMKACENISIATVNSLCAEATYHKQNDCTEEEFAGTPMLCLLSDNSRWSIVGVSSWRIACSHSGTERPRMYDKIESNVSWIREIINSVIN